MATTGEEAEFLRKVNDPKNSNMVKIARIMEELDKNSQERIKRRKG